MGWLNSDDKFLPWTFSVVSEIFSGFPEIEWLTTANPLHWDKDGRCVACFYVGGFNRSTFMGGANLPGGNLHVGPWIQQESTFWRRSLWERTGAGLETSSIAGDFEIWARFFAYAKLYSVAVPLGGFRVHGNQISVQRRGEYMFEGEKILGRFGGKRFSLPRRVLRVALDKGLGGKSLANLPAPVRSGLQRLGIAFPVPIFRWKDGAWNIVQDLIF